MKSLLLVGIFSFFSLVSFGTISKTPDAQKKLQVVEASCGKCNFGIKSNTSDLAVRIGGKAYLVAGTSIDEYGDAHAKDGFCNVIKKAAVQGEIVDGKFNASYFKIVSNKEAKKIKSTKKTSI